MLHSERFVDQAPASVYATLLDENRYLCSISSMNRQLCERGETGERRRQATHPATVKPEVVATQRNQVYSWDITKLLGPTTWSYYYLYVIIDIYSRYVPGWLLADRESSTLAEQLLADTCFKQNIGRDQLSIHADRGSSTASKPVALLLSDLGVTKSRSRPHVSNDNPYSEAQFKTLKYRPDFTKRFGSIEHARSHVEAFIGWYNGRHRSPGVRRVLHHVAVRQDSALSATLLLGCRARQRLAQLSAGPALAVMASMHCRRAHERAIGVVHVATGGRIARRGCGGDLARSPSLTPRER